MIPSRFEYHVPESIEAAVALLTELGDDAKILSGGQSLIPMMKLRLAAPAHIVDINRVPGLASLREADGALHIGALVREADLEESDVVRSRYPIVSDAARHIGDPLVRNLATLCGNLAHGDPANDHPAVMLALDAVAVAVGPSGRREIRMRDFFTGLYSTALAPNEILVEVKIPTPPPRSGGAYVKLERKVGDFATVAVGAQVTLGNDGGCQRAGIGLTNVGPTPIKAVKAEAFLQGKPLNEGTIKDAARAASEESRPTADNRGSVEYKRDLVRVLTGRALRIAADRAAERR
jgi:aerobic carbon-monoxide dehydrogenase medium subunit